MKKQQSAVGAACVADAACTSIAGNESTAMAIRTSCPDHGAADRWRRAEQIRDVSRKSWTFIILSGIATGLSWLCYYRALQDGPISVVLPIDKLSILISIAFAYIIFKERLTRRSGPGTTAIVAGTPGYGAMSGSRRYKGILLHCPVRVLLRAYEPIRSAGRRFAFDPEKFLP